LTRSFQSTPFRVSISTVPLENVPNNEQIHFRLLSDPINVISRKSTASKQQSTSSKQQTPSTNNNISPPSLTSIANSIHKMMEMLENQNKMLQNVQNKMPEKAEEELFHKKKRMDTTEDNLQKKVKEIDSVGESFHLGQEPLQAGLQNLIQQYKEVPKEKKQKRLRQLLCDLSLEDQDVLKEFAEDVLDINNNPALLPTPEDEFNNNPKAFLESLLFSQNGINTYFDKNYKYF